MANVGPPPASERKRVKVYELKNNDWFDRGTGFCKGVVANVRACNGICLT
ncbi:Suppressor of Mek1 [Pyrenophora tritici-repentis]|nr:Suppressor of Mek1 [Pyrenophora tritici-repentis]